MVFMNRPKYWGRLWAGIFSDFENLLILFSQLDSIGYSFVEFAACCIEHEITTILHCTISSGVNKDMHYKTACSMLFNCAKSFWLYPMDGKEMANVEVDVYAKMRAKRKLGGFFLLYLMYMKQPNKNRCKIQMDIGNLEEFFKWKQGISGTSYEEEVNFILLVLHSREAFNYCILSDFFGMSAVERKVLETANDPKLSLMFLKQEIRDEMAKAPIFSKVQEEFIKYSHAKMECFKRMELICGNSIRPQDSSSSFANVAPMHVEDQYMKSKTVHMLRENKGSEELITALEIIKDETDIPIITVPNLIGDPLENLIIISEFKERIRRRLNKLKKLDEHGRYIVMKPYLSESGIFGRHMGVYPEEKEEICKRGSNVKSENLWSYLRGENFGTT